MKDLESLLQKAYRHHQAGNLAEASEFYDRILDINPDYVDAIFLSGSLKLQQGNLDTAENLLEKAKALVPGHAGVYNNLGTVFREQGRHDAAIESYNKAITLKPDNAEAYNNRGIVFQEQGMFDEALANYKKSIEFKPAHYVYSNLGCVLMEKGEYREAIESCKRAIASKPDYAEAHINLGNVLQELGRHDEAILCYDKSVELAPDNVKAHINRAIERLLLEDFERGWPEYEWRLRKEDYVFNHFHQPRWDGSALNGRTILVNTERGFGDSIHFARYLPKLKESGGYVIFECQQTLSRLMRGCSGIDEIVVKHTKSSMPNVVFDVYVPLMSLPGIFSTTLDNIPAEAPYISVDSELTESWRKRLYRNDDFKVGIVWKGNFNNISGRRRSCSLADFAPLAGIPGLVFYSLQKGQEAMEANNPPTGMNIINLDSGLKDFADTAAVIANMDLVISIDTAVVHLAGAMGKPVWTLLHFTPDWRWFLQRDDSPWYPGMSLFRQTQPNDWSGVFEQVKESLSNLGIRIAKKNLHSEFQNG